MKLKKQIKKILVLILVLNLLAGMLHIPANRSIVYADTEITSISIEGLSLEHDYHWPKKNGYWSIWQIYLDTDVDLPEGKEFQVKLRDKTTECNVEFRRSSSEKVAYMKIENTFLPENATKTFTIMAGEYTSTDGTSKIKIKNDYSIHVEGGVWTPVGTTDNLTVEKYMNLELGTAWDNATVCDGSNIYLHTDIDDGIDISDNWSNRLEPVNTDVENGIFYESAAWFADTSDGIANNRNSSYKTAVRLIKFAYTEGRGYSYAICFGDYGIVPTENDLLRVGGNWKDPSTGKIYKYAPMTFRYTGSTWEDVTDTAVDSYAGRLTKKGSAYDKDWFPAENVVSSNLYLKGTDALGEQIKSDSWDSTWLFDLENSTGTVKIDGITVKDLEFRKYNGYENFYYINRLTNINKDSIVTIEGEFEFPGGTVTFEKSQIKWDGLKWVDVIPYSGNLLVTNESGAQIDSTNSVGNLYLKGSDTYLSDRIYEEWNSKDIRLVGADDNSGIFVGGVKESGATLIKYNAGNNWYYLEFAAADITKNLTIKGTFKTLDEMEVLNIEESTFHWNGTKWVNGEINVSSDVSISGFVGLNDASGYWYNPTYDANKKGWRIYLNTENELPGNDNEGYQLELTNGTITKNVNFIRSKSNEIYGYIPEEMVDTNASQTITFKTGEYEAEKDGTKLGYKINLTDEFKIHINQYGWTTETTPIFVNSEHKTDARLNVKASTSAEGFYIDVNKEDAITNISWSDNITVKKIIDNKTFYTGGIYRNNNKTTAFIRKVGENQYYAILSDVGQTAETGDVYTLKGIFCDKDENEVGFSPITVKWTGEAWEQVYTALSDTGVRNDINSDSEANIKDLVSLMHYMSDNLYPVCLEQADIDRNGLIENKDVIQLRKIFAGAISYNEDGSISGIPTYSGNKIFNRAAYSSVKIGVWDKENACMTSYYEDSKVDEDMQKYKACGLNLLISEGVAGHVIDSSKNEGIKKYLEAAERNGLGVIVTSEVLYGFAVNGADNYFNSLKERGLYTNYSSWKDVIDDNVKELKGWSEKSFKGFMIADEIDTSNVQNYIEVANYISNKYPELIIHASQRPVSSDSFSSDNKETEYKEYVKALVNGNDMYTFDLYPLKETYKKGNITGNISDEKIDYNLIDSWFENHRWVADVCKNNNYNFNKGVTIQSCKEVYSSTSSWGTTTTTIGYAPTFNEDIGFQVFTSMAYGVKEINFFTYDGHHSNTNISESIAQNTDVYNAVKTINGQVDKFSNVYLSYDWRDTFDIADGDSYTGDISSTDKGRLSEAKVSGARTLIGHMVDEDGFDGYMVANAQSPRSDVNTAANNATKVTLNFKDATKAVVYDFKTGTKEVKELTNGALDVTVNVGEGTFIIPVK